MAQTRSKYKVPHPIFKNPFVNTMFARLFRPSRNINYQRERITTPDDDFLDLDWAKVGSDTLVLLCHGLESSSRRRYVLSVVNALNSHNYDVASFNPRGCSGEASKHYFITIGQQEDINTIVDHLLETDYQTIYMVGYSTGGNMILRYLGLKAKKINPKIKKAYLVSPTCNLATTIEELHEKKNRFYLAGFLAVMRKRLWQARYHLGYDLNLFDFLQIKSFSDFFNHFQKQYEKKSFAQYLEWNSSINLIKDIEIPSEILLAKDDPFVDYHSYPFDAAMINDDITLELSDYGGHVGFVDFNDGLFYSESRMLEYLAS